MLPKHLAPAGDLTYPVSTRNPRARVGLDASHRPDSAVPLCLRGAVPGVSEVGRVFPWAPRRDAGASPGLQCGPQGRGGPGGREPCTTCTTDRVLQAETRGAARGLGGERTHAKPWANTRGLSPAGVNVCQGNRQAVSLQGEGSRARRWRTRPRHSQRRAKTDACLSAAELCPGKRTPAAKGKGRRRVPGSGWIGAGRGAGDLPAGTHTVASSR